MSILAITEGARRVLENDPHGWTLTLVSVSVVFSCLLILFGVYSLSGAFFSGKLKLRRRKPVSQDTPDAEIAAVIALALEAELSDCAHDVEPGIITIRQSAGEEWSDRRRNFRRAPGTSRTRQ